MQPIHTSSMANFTIGRRQTYPEGTMLDVWNTGKYLGQIKQVRKTYNVVGNMNEYKVVIGETTYGGWRKMAKA